MKPKTNIESYWYNFFVDHYEYIETPTDFTHYIPQQAAALDLYDCYIKLGETPLEAAIKVLSACVGEGKNVHE